jgi:hypothetical protein
MAYNWGKAAKDRRPDMARAANPVCYDIFWKTRHAKEKRIMDGMMQQNIMIAQQQQQQQPQQQHGDLNHLPALGRRPVVLAGAAATADAFADAAAADTAAAPSGSLTSIFIRIIISQWRVPKSCRLKNFLSHFMPPLSPPAPLFSFHPPLFCLCLRNLS